MDLPIEWLQPWRPAASIVCSTHSLEICEMSIYALLSLSPSPGFVLQVLSSTQAALVDTSRTSALVVHDRSVFFLQCLLYFLLVSLPRLLRLPQLFTTRRSTPNGILIRMSRHRALWSIGVNGKITRTSRLLITGGYRHTFSQLTATLTGIQQTTMPTTLNSSMTGCQPNFGSVVTLAVS